MSEGDAVDLKHLGFLVEFLVLDLDVQHWGPDGSAIVRKEDEL